MNNNFIPNVTPDGNEKGEHPAADSQPALPTECIKLPESPSATVPSKRWPGWLINEAAEITDEMWASLRPSAVTPVDWFGRSPGTAPLGIKDRIVEKITSEKRGKIFPLSWDRVQFLADQAFQEWRRAEAATFESDPSSMDGLCGMRWDDAEKLIFECVAQSGYRLPNSGNAGATMITNICHRVANAAHKRGAQEMQKVMDAKNPPTTPSDGFWFRKQLEQIWCAKAGSPITADMKRAARVAIQVVDGCKLDGMALQAPKAEKPAPSSQELQSQALGEQASLMGFDVVAAALVADVPLPIPPGSAIWPKIRPEMEERANPGAPGSFIESELRARASRGVGAGRLDDDFRERERAAWFEREADRAAALLGTSLFDPEPPAPGSVGTKPQQDGDRPLPCGNVPRA